jgi:hypothetical protein
MAVLIRLLMLLLVALFIFMAAWIPVRFNAP